MELQGQNGGEVTYKFQGDKLVSKLPTARTMTIS